MQESTGQYFWSTADIIGSGSTADVYRAIRKCDGEIVAAKVFHPVTNASWNGDQIESSFKELATMKKLSHANVVKLLGVDVWKSDRSAQPRRVLIMEYCFRGSLQTMLEKSENYYGIKQSDFMQLFADLARGMQYLRSQNIIHRDIKPSNIMVQLNDNGGSNIYKLADFGTAKHLLYDYDEGFQSLVGTAEYLAPPMFEHWLMREHGPIFKAESELWTVGVTLYQAATGKIPFRPNLGVRKDYSTMLKIIKEKPMGCLSGVQYSENGPIEYSDKLPQTCHYSATLRKVLEPLLGRLLDSYLTSSYPFDAFFCDALSIKKMRSIKLFDACKFMNEEVTIHPKTSISKLLEEVCHVFNLRKENILALSKGQCLNNNDATYLSSSIETMMNASIIVYSNASNDYRFKPPQIYEVREIKRKNNVRDAYNWAKEMTGSMYYIYKISKRFKTFTAQLNTISSSICNMINCSLRELMIRLNFVRCQCTDIDRNLLRIAHCSAHKNEPNENFSCRSYLKELRIERDELAETLVELEMLVSPQALLNPHFFDGEEQDDVRGMSSLLESADFLLAQFESETKLQNFNAERTCAHMRRRFKLRMLWNKMLTIYSKDICISTQNLHASCSLWICENANVCLRQQQAFSDLFNSSSLSNRLQTLLLKCKKVAEDCSNELPKCNLSDLIENEEAEQKNTQYYKKQQDEESGMCAKKQLLERLAELKQQQISVDDSILENDTIVKNIQLLLSACDDNNFFDYDSMYENERG